MGIGGLPAAFGAGAGLAATGGFGLVAIGGPGGLISVELEGREAGAEEVADAVGVFFHGVAEPFEGPMPGKIAIGLLETSADTELAIGFGAACGVGRFGGGGGVGTGAALGGTSSR